MRAAADDGTPSGLGRYSPEPETSEEETFPFYYLREHWWFEAVGVRHRKMDDSVPYLHVTLIRGASLPSMKKIPISGLPDTYVALQILKSANEPPFLMAAQRSSIIRETANPEWREVFEFRDVYLKYSFLYVAAYHSRRVGKDYIIGEAVLNLADYKLDTSSPAVEVTVELKRKEGSLLSGLRSSSTPSVPTLKLELEAANEPVVAHPVLKEGFLFKEGGETMARQFNYQTSLMWQSRWFEVKRGDISYKELPTSKQLKGSIKELSACKVYESEPENFSKLVGPSYHYFSVATPGGRVYRFRTPEESERDEWIKAFAEAGCEYIPTPVRRRTLQSSGSKKDTSPGDSPPLTQQNGEVAPLQPPPPVPQNDGFQPPKPQQPYPLEPGFYPGPYPYAYSQAPPTQPSGQPQAGPPPPAYDYPGPYPEQGYYPAVYPPPVYPDAYVTYTPVTTQQPPPAPAPQDGTQPTEAPVSNYNYPPQAAPTPALAPTAAPAPAPAPAPTPSAPSNDIPSYGVTEQIPKPREDSHEKIYSEMPNHEVCCPSDNSSAVVAPALIKSAPLPSNKPSDDGETFRPSSPKYSSLPTIGNDSPLLAHKHD